MEGPFVSMDEMPEATQLEYEIYTLKVLASGILRKMEGIFGDERNEATEVSRCITCRIIEDVVQLEGWAAQATRNKFHG